ncbi:DUF327 family protein [bacterium]|nr:DUF327 family protein [bacterium]
MTKIDPLGQGMGALPGVKRAKRKNAAGTEPEPEYSGGGIPTDVLPLVEEIAKTGTALASDPTGEHLEQYKYAVRRFLDQAVNTSMKVNSEATLGLSQKVFSTIARIDLALADLADAVLGRQQDLLKTATLIDQIKGLVVDLYN